MSFHNTLMGRKFFETTLPSIAKSLVEISKKDKSTSISTDVSSILRICRHLDLKDFHLRNVGYKFFNVTMPSIDKNLQTLTEKKFEEFCEKVKNKEIVFDEKTGCFYEKLENADFKMSSLLDL